MPAHTRDYDTGANRHHFNSTIISHAYYLLAEEVGREVSEQVVYRALVEHLDPDAGFEDLRTAMLQAAGDLHGDGSAEQEAVSAAFEAVGLDGTWEAGR